MIDVLTGKKIYLDNDTITPHITYTFKSEVNEDTLIKIYEKYKKLSKKELERYKKGIESIEKTAIINYNDYIKSIEEKREKYNNACIYINELVENNTF